MYSEQPATLPHVIAWRSVAPPGSHGRVLPDGCLDLIWENGAVFIAGPDTVTEETFTPAGATLFALRFAAGTGPAVLGVPADEFTDRAVPLDAVWPAAEVRAIAEADDPAAALEAAARRRWHEPDRSLVRLAAQARAGWPVDAIAAGLGLSPRQLQRRSHAGFGYGPKLLTRILRMQRALGMARRGTPLAEVSARSGYADQAHLSRDVKVLAGVPLGVLIRPAA
jgi:AraC-like DNA-binding protein